MIQNHVFFDFSWRCFSSTKVMHLSYSGDSVAFMDPVQYTLSVNIEFKIELFVSE